MASDPSYSAYVRYAGMVGSPILSYEAWSRLRYELDKPEAIRKREKLLAAENKILQRTGPTVDSSRQTFRVRPPRSRTRGARRLLELRAKPKSLAFTTHSFRLVPSDEPGNHRQTRRA